MGVRWVGLPEGEGRSVWLDPCSDQSLEYQERFFQDLFATAWIVGLGVCAMNTEDFS